jgi:hypothetical protein
MRLLVEKEDAVQKKEGYPGLQGWKRVHSSVKLRLLWTLSATSHYLHLCASSHP